MNKHIVLLIIFVLLSISCRHSPKETKSHAKTYQVKSEKVVQSLYFTGTIQPLKESLVTSPFDSTIETVKVQYGQYVKKGEIIAILKSNELQKQFNDVLTGYLKAKENYSITKAKFIGTEDLWKAGIISKNNFLSEKSSMNNARVSLMQSQKKLYETMEKVDYLGEKDLINLNLSDFDRVKDVLNTAHNIIKLRAPISGLLLNPPSGSNEKKPGRLTSGSTLKSGQPVALIGDLRGLKIEIDIPEADITQISPGMEANITSIPLGSRTLHGELVTINGQANPSNSGSLPSFNAIIHVKKLSTAEQLLIKVGMSAAIELKITNSSQLQVPIVAIQHEGGENRVKVLAKDGSFKENIVTTGSVQADKVVIKSGLKENDVVVYG
jgi:HlyD family secretion protein